jgi:formate-dependent nitrite reductase membrane component NrfD
METPMGPPPSDTFFTASPHWGWLIVLYFFFGGLAGGSYFLAALLDIFFKDRRLARLGYLVALPCFAVCPILLVADLERPERFWHMLFMSERGAPILKWWSPMSYGSWGLSLFGLFAALSFGAAIAEGDGRKGDGKLASALRPLRALRERAWLRLGIAVLGGGFAILLASYTGVLLSVTNRPVWADTTLLGGLFTVSAAASSAALLLLIARRTGAAEASSMEWLAKIEVRFALIELVVLALFVISLGPVARVWIGAWGALLVFGVGVLGIALPLLLHARPRIAGRASPMVAAAMVLVGAFVLRAVIVLSSEAL